MSPTDKLPPLPITCTVPEFGAVVLDHKSDNPSYEAAKAGLIPVIECGIGGQKVQRYKVPVRRALQMVAGGDQALLDQLVCDFAAKLTRFRDAKAKKRRAA